jgi:hypothetical protein
MSGRRRNNGSTSTTDENGVTRLTDFRTVVAPVRRRGRRMPAEQGFPAAEPDSRTGRFRLYWDPKRRVLLRTR